MMQFTMSGTMLRFDETTLRFSFSRDGATWSGCDGIEPQLTREDRSFSFAGAATVTHERIETGTGSRRAQRVRRVRGCGLRF